MVKEGQQKEFNLEEVTTTYILKFVLVVKEKEKLLEKNVIFVNLKKSFLVLKSLLWKLNLELPVIQI